MKTTIKIAVIAMLMFNVNLFSQGSFKNYVKNFTVNSTTLAELTDKEGNTLNLNNIYKVQLVTRGTGTDTGAEYLVWSNDSLWNVRVVNSNGNSSNHPILVIEDNIVKVKTNHTSNYGVRAFVEELVTEEGDVRPNIFGSSYQWQRYTGKLFYTDGNVGIGTISPQAKLNVQGTFQVGTTASYDAGVLSTSYENGSLYLNMIEYDDPLVMNFKQTLNPDYHEKIYFNKGGFGIGISDTKGFKLGVNGKVVATEVKVATYANWADFVFAKDYELPTLTDVENHIKEKGHLKDIPSAKEVEKNGFFLGEMDAKLLQKIEELTLYTIQQEKKIKVLEKQNSKIKELEKLVKKLIEDKK